MGCVADRQKGQTCYLSWRLNKTERDFFAMPVIKNCYNILFFITWIVYISTYVVCFANCFRCLGLGGSDPRHGLLYSNASLLFLQGTGFSIAPTTTKQKTKAATSRDLIASGFVKTRFTNVHQRLYASVLCTSCFGSASFDTDEHYVLREKRTIILHYSCRFSPNPEKNIPWTEMTNT